MLVALSVVQGVGKVTVGAKLDACISKTLAPQFPGSRALTYAGLGFVVSKK